MIQSGSGKFGLAVLAALGIDPSMVVGFTLRCYVGECATVEVERYVEVDSVDAATERVRTAVEEYEVVPKGGPNA